MVRVMVLKSSAEPVLHSSGFISDGIWVNPIQSAAFTLPICAASEPTAGTGMNSGHIYNEKIYQIVPDVALKTFQMGHRTNLKGCKMINGMKNKKKHLSARQNYIYF